MIIRYTIMITPSRLLKPFKELLLKLFPILKVLLKISPTVLFSEYNVPVHLAHDLSSLSFPLVLDLDLDGFPYLSQFFAKLLL